MIKKDCVSFLWPPSAKIPLYLNDKSITLHYSYIWYKDSFIPPLRNAESEWPVLASLYSTPEYAWCSPKFPYMQDGRWNARVHAPSLLYCRSVLRTGSPSLYDFRTCPALLTNRQRDEMIFSINHHPFFISRIPRGVRTGCGSGVVWRRDCADRRAWSTPRD